MNKYQEALNKLSNEYNVDLDSIEKFIKVVIKHSPKCSINTINELIIEPKNNIYFRLDNVDSMLTLKCKVLAWLSRPSCKGVSDYYQKKMRSIFNEFLGTNFNKDEMELIYTYLGNNCNIKKSIKFIESNYNLDVLDD